MSGFERANYTQAPNAFFDKVLKDIDSMSELKVTLAVIRHTMGFHREAHELSLTYLVEYTGMRRETVIDGLKRAMKRGTVDRYKSGNTFAYFMKVVGKPDQDAPSGSRKTGPVASRKTGPKKEREKEIHPTGDAGASPKNRKQMDVNWFTFFCDLAGSFDIIITPEDRQNTAKHFKDLVRREGPSDVEMKKVISKMLEARTSGYDMSPQKALGKVRGSNVTPLRAHRTNPEAEQRASTAGYRQF